MGYQRKYMGKSEKTKWEEDQQDATDTARESHSPRVDTTEVYPIPESGFTILVTRRLLGTLSPSASTSSRTRENSFLPRPSRLQELPATSTWSTTPERTTST